MRLAGPHQVINGSIKDVQLYTCNYDKIKYVEARNHVLYPVTLSVAGSTPEDKGLHLELLVTDIRLSVSPAIIELLSRVLKTATGGGSAAVADETEDKDYSDVWNCSDLKEQDYWFFRTDEATEATESVKTMETTSRKNYQEMCILSIPSIVVTMEAGVGTKTLPMLIIESSLRGNVCNWSSQLSVEAGLTLQMNYYNSRLALWEPLIEPVEIVSQGQSKWVPWELKLEVSMNDREDVASPTSESESFDPIQQQALMCVDISSDHSMELVVTKTCIEVLSNLGKAFSSAMTPSTQVTSLEVLAPYKVVNELGCLVKVDLALGTFSLFKDDSASEVILESGAEVELQRKVELRSSPTLGMLMSREGVDLKKYVINVRVRFFFILRRFMMIRVIPNLKKSCTLMDN